MLVDAKIIKAVTLAATKKDIRFYLNGVFVNATHIVATDGARLHAYKHGQEWQYGEVIIPIEKVELALKMKTEQIKIDKSCINDIPFAPVDGRFPDYTRVIPQNTAPAVGEIMASVNPEFLLDACKAVKLVTGVKTYPVLASVGTNVWTWRSELFSVVVMGVYTEKNPPSLEYFS